MGSLLRSVELTTHFTQEKNFLDFMIADRLLPFAGLLGNVIDVHSGQWVGTLSGIGAGMDSFFEYLLKSYILFGDRENYVRFNESYSLIKRYVRSRSRSEKLRWYMST